MRARLLFAILALVTGIVLGLSGLHLYGVVGGALEDAGERATMLTEQVHAYLLEAVNRRVASARPISPEESKKIWYEAVRNDELLNRFLDKSLTLCAFVVDIVIVDDQNRILAAAGPGRIGQPDTPARSWNEWQKGRLTKRLYDVFESREDLAISVPVGAPGFDKPVLTVRTHLSPVLLRAAVEPQIYDLATLSLFSLALSGVLAVLVSNTVANSLERIKDKIDQIARGETADPESDQFTPPELVDLDSKLWWLGRQFSGARADVLQLRTSIDRMLRKLEEAVFVFTPENRLQFAGEAAERLLAKPRDAMLGETLDTIFPAWSGLGGVLRKACSQGAALRDHPVKLERMNMPSVNLLLTVEPIHNDEGASSGTLVTLRDADTRRQIRTDFQIAQRLAAIGRISSGVAHEIKNPLNAMMLHLALATEKAADSPDLRGDLEITTRELQRLDRVVKTLLDFNRPVDVRMTETDLRDFANEVAKLIQPQANAQSVLISMDLLPQSAPVLVDSDLMKQAALNVAVNALEAMPSGGKLTFGVRGEPHRYVLAIYDTGPGIPPELRDKIFNLYFTTKQSGSGIGLAMTYRIMELHAGEIQVDSEPGQGACFRLSLPEHQSREVAA